MSSLSVPPLRTILSLSCGDLGKEAASRRSLPDYMGGELLACHDGQHQTVMAFEGRHQPGQEAENRRAQIRLAAVHVTMSASCTAGSEERSPDRVTGMGELAGSARCRMASLRGSPMPVTNSVRIADGHSV
jgi:hypothetical protein